MPNVDDLWWAYLKDRSVANRNVLILEYMPFARTIAKHIAMKNDRLAYEDACAAAYVGLIDVIERYDPQKNVSFKAYANRRIAGAVHDWVRQAVFFGRNCKATMYVADPTEFAAFIVATESSPVESCAKSMWWEYVTRGLTPRERQIMILYYRDGLTCREIASLLGITLSAVDQFRQIALSWLRHRLTGNERLEVA